MGYKILEIEDTWRLAYQFNNIVCYINDKKIPIHINDIDILLINNPTLSLSCRIINELTNNNTLIVACNEKHLPQTLILPISGHYNSLKILQSQIN